MAIQSEATAQLGAIPFENLIGGPLDAAVKAQAVAARSSVDFIRDVAIMEDGSVRNVIFTYMKADAKVELIVPILTIVPVPFLRIDDMTISFKASISAETSSEDTTTASRTASVSGGGSVGWGPWKASFKAGYSSKKDSTSTRDSRYSVEYTMDINVHAVQDDIPAGLSRVLDMLEKSIEAAPPVNKPALIEVSGLDSIQPGAISVSLEVSVFDKEDNQVEDGTLVKCLSSGAGTLDSRRKNTSGGKATFTISSVSSGNTVTVTISSGAAEPVTISAVVPGLVITVSARQLTAAGGGSSIISVSGGSGNYNFTVEDDGGTGARVSLQSGTSTTCTVPAGTTPTGPVRIKVEDALNAALEGTTEIRVV